MNREPTVTRPARSGILGALITGTLVGIGTYVTFQLISALILAVTA